MSALSKLAVSAALTSALAGCSGIDAGQARTCRSVIPALNPAQATFKIERTAPLAGGEGVRIDYRASGPVGHPRDRYLEWLCAGGGLASPDRGSLVGVRTEEGPMGELRLRLLRRFWLDAEGAAADPEPVPGASLSLEVPRGLAVGLQHVVFALPSVSIYA